MTCRSNLWGYLSRLSVLLVGKEGLVSVGILCHGWLPYISHNQVSSETAHISEYGDIIAGPCAITSSASQLQYVTFINSNFRAYTIYLTFHKSFFEWMLLNDMFDILIQIVMKFVPGSLIDNKPASLCVMTWLWNKWQAITWTKYNKLQWFHMASPSNSELIHWGWH